MEISKKTTKRIPVMLWITLLGTLGVWSCEKERTFEAYQGMETQKWHVKDTANFQLPTDIVPGPTIVGIKYNQDYEYRNIYVRYVLKDSSGHVLETQLLDVPLFEIQSGKPLGKGFGSSFTKYDTIPINSKIDFSSVDLIQYMRVDELTGIEAVGIKRIK